jgi:pimeloyl-ACP methyl ester carboxylesterase
MTVVLMYGAGEGGPGGWPVQAADGGQGWTYLDRLPATADQPVPFDEPHRDADRIVETVEAVPDGAHLVAHSGGSVPALLAVARTPSAVRSLTLFEPACLGVSRGRPGTEEMVAALGAVFERAGDAGFSDGQFAADFMVAMGAPAVDPADPGSAGFGRQLRLSTPPWQVPVSLDAIGTVPTLVVTGGWSTAFDEVADVLVAAGAQHVVVPGTGHAPQYHPDGHAAMTGFQAAYG